MRSSSDSNQTLLASEVAGETAFIGCSHLTSSKSDWCVRKSRSITAVVLGINWIMVHLPVSCSWLPLLKLGLNGLLGTLLPALCFDSNA
jgi:hypothetical protein